MGPSGLLPIREEGVLRIFITLKNPSPWPGSNLRSWGGKHTNRHIIKATKAVFSSRFNWRTMTAVIYYCFKQPYSTLSREKHYTGYV
jgi:hypothetical protein